MTTTIGVLAMQGDFEEHIAALGGQRADVVEVRLPQQLAGLAGLIVPGGESTAIARLLHEWDLLTAIRERARAGMAVWGTCAGAILLAEQAPGLDREGLRLMDISVERNAFGRQVDSFEAMLEIAALGARPFPAVFIRAPRITDTGKDVRVLARLADGTVAAARQGTLLATTFHPELTGDSRFHEYFVTMAAGGQDASAPSHDGGVASRRQSASRV